MSAKKEKNVKEKKKISLTSMIFIALIAGAITGMVLHYLVPDSSVKNDVIVEGVLYVLGQGFIRLMKNAGSTSCFLLTGMWKYGYW